jgi:subtilase family serine protease
MPTVSAGGWASTRSFDHEYTRDGVQGFEWHGSGDTHPPFGVAIEAVGNGSFRLGGPLTFRVLPTEPSEVGTKAFATIFWDYSAYWDLDPMRSNHVYASASMSPIGKFFDFDEGWPPDTPGGSWNTADNSGFPLEEDEQDFIVTVGQTYTVSVNAGGATSGLWIGATDSHGDVGLFVKVGVALETFDPDISVTLGTLDRGGVTVNYTVTNSLPQDSEIALYWGKVARVATGSAPIGPPIHTIPVGQFDSKGSVQIPATALENPPLGATRLIAIADPKQQIHELSEKNNRDSIPILNDLDLDISFGGPVRYETKLTPSCFSFDCTHPVVNKGDSYQLIANVTNHRSVFPVKMSFDYTETPLGSLPLAGTMKTNIKPIVIRSGETRAVTLDNLQRTWDWIPADNPFTEPLHPEVLEDAANVGGELHEYFQDNKVKVTKGVLKYASVLDGLLTLGKIGTLLSEMHSEIDFRYHVTTRPVEAFVQDTDTLQVEVPDNLRGKLTFAASVGVLANMAKSASIAAAIAAIGSGGLAIPVAVTLYLGSYALEDISDKYYVQAFDPPDPNFQVLAMPVYAAVDPSLTGFSRAVTATLQNREALTDAESKSRDRALGARDANDLIWYADQLVASSGLALAGAVLDTRLMTLQSLMRPLLQNTAANPRSFDDAIADSFPPEVQSMLADDLGVPPEEIEILRQGLVQTGAARLFAHDPLVDLYRAQSLTSSSTSITELQQAIDIRTQSLGLPVEPLSTDHNDRLLAVEDEINLGFIAGVPTRRLLDNIDTFLQETHQAALQSNNFFRASPWLEKAHDFLQQFQAMDLSPAVIGRILAENEFGMSPEIATDLQQRFAALQSAFAGGDFDAGRSQLADFAATVEAARGIDIFHDPAAEQLLGFTDLLLSSIDIADIAPAIVRPPAKVQVYEASDDRIVDLAGVFADRDANAPFAFAIVYNTNADLVTASMETPDSVRLAFTPGVTGQATVKVSATDGAGNEAMAMIAVEAYPRPWDIDILPLDDVVVDEGEPVDFFIDAQVFDPEFQERVDPGYGYFEYEVLTDLPGVAVVGGDGQFVWNTTDEIGGQAFDVDVRVTGLSVIPVEQIVSFRATVRDTLMPPVLTPIGDLELITGAPLNLQATAIDYDMPAETLSFSINGEPSGMTIHPTTGVVSWTPLQTGTFPFTVVATDSTGRSDSELVTAKVFAGALPPRVIDLKPAGMLVRQKSATWGGTVAVETVVENGGPDAGGPFEIGWYLSKSPTGGTDDMLLPLADGAMYRTTDGVEGGMRSGTFQTELQLPASRPAGFAGDMFYVVPKIDATNTVAESNESNNSRTGVAWVSFDELRVTESGVNLRAAGQSSTTVLQEWGDTVELAFTVENAGSMSSGEFDVAWYFSADAIGSPDDIPLILTDGGARVRFPALSANSYSDELTARLVLPAVQPENWTGMDAWIIAKIDVGGEIIESDENDNFGQTGESIGSTQHRMLIADLTVAMSPDLKWAAWGENIASYITVSNQGEMAAGPFEVAWFLTDDPIGQGALVPIAPLDDTANAWSGLDAIAADSRDLVFPLPAVAPPELSGEQYWILARIDVQDEVAESDETNNMSPMPHVQPLLVSLPGDDRADLRPVIYAVSQLSDWHGTLDVTTYVANAGLTDAGPFDVAWYLSIDPDGSPDDIPLAVVGGGMSYRQPSVTAGEFFGGPIDVQLQLTGAPPFDWQNLGAHVVAKVDVQNEVDERYEHNNFRDGYLLSSIVDLPDVLVPTTFHNLPLATHDRLTLPVGIWGSDVQLNQAVINYATAPADSFDLRWYLSRDGEFDDDDVALSLADGSDHVTVAGLDSFEQVDLNHLLRLPAALPNGWDGLDFYFLTLADADDVLLESDETNNIAVDRWYITAPAAPDLRAVYTSVYGDALRWGETFSVDVRIQNTGNQRAEGGFHVAWYLSQDETASPDDVLLLLEGGETSLVYPAGIEGRDHFGTFGFSRFFLSDLIYASLQLPPSRPAGWQGDKMYIITRTDVFADVVESDEGNNFGQVGLFADRDFIQVDDGSSWHHWSLPTDVNADGRVTPLDVLLVINEINLRQYSQPNVTLPLRPIASTLPYFDVNKDGFVTPLDVLIVINWINAHSENESGEGEAQTLDNVGFRAPRAESHRGETHGASQVFATLATTPVARAACATQPTIDSTSIDKVCESFATWRCLKAPRSIPMEDFLRDEHRQAADLEATLDDLLLHSISRSAPPLPWLSAPFS